MRVVDRVFLTLLTKSLTYKKLPVEKLFIYVQKSFSQNLRLLLIRMRNTYGSYGLLEKNTRWPASHCVGHEHVPIRMTRKTTAAFGLED